MPLLERAEAKLRAKAMAETRLRAEGIVRERQARAQASAAHQPGYVLSHGAQLKAAQQRLSEIEVNEELSALRARGQEPPLAESVRRGRL